MTIHYIWAVRNMAKHSATAEDAIARAKLHGAIAVLIAEDCDFWELYDRQSAAIGPEGLPRNFDGGWPIPQELRNEVRRALNLK